MRDLWLENTISNLSSGTSKIQGQEKGAVTEGAGVHVPSGWVASTRGNEAQGKARAGRADSLCRGCSGEGSPQAGTWGMNGNCVQTGSGSGTRLTPMQETRTGTPL